MCVSVRAAGVVEVEGVTDVAPRDGVKQNVGGRHRGGGGGGRDRGRDEEEEEEKW